MLKPPKIGGAGQLRLFIDQIGFDRSCQILDIHPSTMRGWLREARPVPQAPLQALYWLTSYGFSDAEAEVHWSHQFMLCKMRQMSLERDQARSVNGLLVDIVQNRLLDGVGPLAVARLDQVQEPHQERSPRSRPVTPGMAG